MEFLKKCEKLDWVAGVLWNEGTVESRFKKDFGLLNRDSFLFQTQENPWKSIALQNEHLKEYKYLIAFKLSNASDYICRYFHPLIRKI